MRGLRAAFSFAAQGKACLAPEGKRPERALEFDFVCESTRYLGTAVYSHSIVAGGLLEIS
jgi:hypothetical protein